MAEVEDKFSVSRKLADHEAEQAKLRASTIQIVINTIDALLIEKEITIREWGEIIDAFNGRGDLVIPNLTIKEIKERLKS